jgi:hypothetical protein
VNDGAPTEAGATTGGNHRAEDTTEVHPLFAWRDLIQKSDLPPTARHVALNLSTHMNLNGGSCFPSLETQASETGLHKSTAKSPRMGRVLGAFPRRRCRHTDPLSAQVSLVASVAEDDRCTRSTVALCARNCRIRRTNCRRG